MMKRLAFGDLPLHLLQRLSVQQMIRRQCRRVQPFHQRQPRALGHGQNTKGLAQRAAAHQPGDQRQAQQGGLFTSAPWRVWMQPAAIAEQQCAEQQRQIGANGDQQRGHPQ